MPDTKYKNDQSVSFHQAALDALDLGLPTIPVDLAKQPTVNKWGPFQQRLPNKQEIDNMFDDPTVKGIALITGSISGNLEVLDIDCKYDLTGTLYEDVSELLKEHVPELIPRFVIAKTVNNGYHIFFRVSSASLQGNQRLASRPPTVEETEKGDKNKVLLETRGQGGYVVIKPTPGYSFIQGNLSTVPTITDSEREAMMTIARSFDQMPVAETKEERTFRQKNSGLSPFDDYNARADVPALLERHGYKFVYERGDRIHYLRPGPTKSKTSANWHKARRIFFMHSSSTEFEPSRGYNPTQVYTILEHKGDYSASSKQMLKDGFGEAFKAANAKDQVNFEIEPRPLDLTLKPVEHLDDSCLPEILVNWLRPSSKIIGCPFDFLVLAAIVTIGSFIGSRLRIKPVTVNDWVVVPNLYVGLVGPPSTKKTPALDEIRKPILELQAKARKEFNDKKKDFEIEATYYEREKQAVYRNKDLGLSKTKEKINELPEPDKPIMTRYEVNDITSPKLAQYLSENDNGLLQFRDELAGWLRALDADYDTNARTFYLELWKGAATYSKARVGDGETHIQSGTLSILGGIQPSKLLRYVAEAYSFDNSDGLLQRFLFSYPDPLKEKKKPTQADYEAMRRGYNVMNEFCKGLVEFDFAGKTVGENGDRFHVVKFSPEAQKIADEWFDEIEAEAKSLEVEDEPFSAYLYKLPKSCFAIALIFHCLENLDKAVFPDEISKQTILKTIVYVGVLLSHARRVFALGENQIFALAHVLIGKIKKGGLKQGFTVREATRKQWSGLGSKDTVIDVLQVLIDYGWLMEIRAENGRPTNRYYFHESLEPDEGGGD